LTHTRSHVSGSALPLRSGVRERLDEDGAGKEMLYDEFTDLLRARLEADPRVRALVALGSTAAPELRDEHSDHDFWVVVEDGERAGFVADPGWLPDAGEIVAWVRQGERYGTALFESGQVVEVGIFEVAELSSGRLSHYRVCFDRAGIAETLAEIAANSPSRSGRLDDRPECEILFLTLLTGACRAARGEHLSAQKYLAYHALDMLLGLLARRDPSEPDGRDPLDPWRRVESTDAQLATELLSVLRLPAIEAARRLFEIALRELRPDIPDFPEGAAAVVRRELERLGHACERKESAP